MAGNAALLLRASMVNARARSYLMHGNEMPLAATEYRQTAIRQRTGWKEMFSRRSLLIVTCLPLLIVQGEALRLGCSHELLLVSLQLLNWPGRGHRRVHVRGAELELQPGVGDELHGTRMGWTAAGRTLYLLLLAFGS